MLSYKDIDVLHKHQIKISQTNHIEGESQDGNNKACYYKGAYRMNTYNGKERGWIRGCPSMSKTYNT